MEAREKTERLNAILAFELAGVLQYQQQSHLLQGLWRKEFAKYFQEESDGCLKHSRQLGSWVAGLGGIPTIEPGMIKQSTSLEEMLEHDLELEERTLDAYTTLARDASDEMTLRVLAETHALDEQRSVFELQKILEQVRYAQVPEEVGLRAVPG